MGALCRLCSKCCAESGASDVGVVGKWGCTLKGSRLQRVGEGICGCGKDKGLSNATDGCMCDEIVARRSRNEMAHEHPAGGEAESLNLSAVTRGPVRCAHRK